MTRQPMGNFVEFLFQLRFLAVFPSFGSSGIDPVLHAAETGMPEEYRTSGILQKRANPGLRSEILQIGSARLGVLEFAAVSVARRTVLSEKFLAFREWVAAEKQDRAFGRDAVRGDLDHPMSHDLALGLLLPKRFSRFRRCPVLGDG